MNHVGLMILLIANSAPVAAAPAFGLRPGTPVRQLDIKQKLTELTFEVRPPIPNATFERYVVVAAPKVGACQIWADTRRKQTDAELNGQFSRLIKALSTLYGEPSREYNGGAGYYEMGAASFDARWSTHLPPGIESIELSRPGLGEPKPKWVSVIYTFRNWRSCKNWVPDQNTSGL